MEKSSRNDSKGCNYVRFLVATVCILYMSFVQASVMSFNTAYVVLSNRTTSPLYGAFLLQNQSAAGAAAAAAAESTFDWAPSYLTLAEQRYPYTPTERSFTFAASFAGGLLGTFPMLYMLRHAGAHTTMFIVGTVSALACGLTPQAMSLSFWAFVLLRFVSGFVTAPLFPLMGTIIEEWAGMDEKGLFLGLLGTHMEIAAIFANPVASLIAEKVSWPLVFYLHGLLCALVTVLWLALYRDDPAKHPMISSDEVERINRGKHRVMTKTATPSLLAVFSSTSVWSIFIAAIGMIFVGQFMGVFAPQYFTAVLLYSPTITGSLTLIPTFAALPIKFVVGILSDKLTMVSEVFKLRLFNSIACFLGAVFFIVTVLVPPSSSIPAATAVIMIPFILLSFTTGGFHKAAILISRQHASFLFSVVHIFAMITLLVCTFLIPQMVPDNTFDQWKTIFILFSAVLVISNVIFIIFVKAEPEKWAEPKLEFIQLSGEPRSMNLKQ